MKKKPIIGIVGRVNLKDKEAIFVFDQYRQAIIQEGGIPILLLPTYEKPIFSVSPFCNNVSAKAIDSIQILVDLCDGILFPGGNEWYGFDQVIYQIAYKKDIPILGICLGLQMIGSAPYFQCQCSDATIPVNSIINHQQKNSYVHDVLILNGKLKEILNQSLIRVNSRHSSCITTHNSFSVSAISEDGVIEAIEIPNKKFILGIQWHPESNYEYDISSKQIFQAFLKACSLF